MRFEAETVVRVAWLALLQHLEDGGDSLLNGVGGCRLPPEWCWGPEAAVGSGESD